MIVTADAQSRMSLGRRVEPNQQFRVQVAHGRIALVYDEQGDFRADDRGRVRLVKHVTPGKVYNVEVKPRGVLIEECIVVAPSMVSTEIWETLKSAVMGDS